ncbi:MAG: hypothetical protein ACPIOQ_52395, partial [Promethearchaeia archaeon]
RRKRTAAAGRALTDTCGAGTRFLQAHFARCCTDTLEGQQLDAALCASLNLPVGTVWGVKMAAPSRSSSAASSVAGESPVSGRAEQC